MSDHGSPPPTARVAAAAQHGMLGRYLGSEAPSITKTSWIGGLLTVVTVLLVLYGCLAIATDVMPLRDGFLLSLIVAGLGLTAAWLIRSGAVVHCFVDGAVVEPRQGRGPLRAFHRTDLAPYEWIRLDQSVQGSRTVATLQLRTTGDGREIARFSGAQAVRFAELLVAWELPHALDRLAVGGQIRYGDLRISREALQVQELTLPWSQIRGIQPHFDDLLVNVRDNQRPVARVDAKRTPHRRALQAIAMHLTTEPSLSRQSDEGPNRPQDR